MRICVWCLSNHHQLCCCCHCCCCHCCCRCCCLPVINILNANAHASKKTTLNGATTTKKHMKKLYSWRITHVTYRCALLVNWIILLDAKVRRKTYGRTWQGKRYVQILLGGIHEKKRRRKNNDRIRSPPKTFRECFANGVRCSFCMFRVCFTIPIDMYAVYNMHARDWGGMCGRNACVDNWQLLLACIFVSSSIAESHKLPLYAYVQYM